MPWPWIALLAWLAFQGLVCGLCHADDRPNLKSKER